MTSKSEIPVILFLLLVGFIMLNAAAALADNRIDYGEGCHFVLPSGIAAGNNGDEAKESGCKGSIITNADGTRNGSAIYKVKYAFGTVPFSEDFSYTSDPATTNIVCNMDDTNNTYQTKEWRVSYKAEVEGLDDFNDAFFTDDPEYDFNGDGFVDYADLTIFSADAKGRIKYTLACYNGVQQ